MAKLSVASNDTVRDAAGHDVKETTWLPVVAYGAAARIVAEQVHKGSKLEVEGELRNRTFGEGDAKRTVSEVHVIPGRGKVSLKEAAANVAEAAGDGRSRRAPRNTTSRCEVWKADATSYAEENC